MKPNIKKIVLTGGPGAGKSTSLPFLKETFEKQGYRVLIVPETATDLINSGIAPWTSPSNTDFQRVLLDVQLHKGNTFEEFAKQFPDEKILIFLDRGIPDNKAFMDKEDFEKLLEEKGMNNKDLFDRYDAVFHLESPAKIYPECYTLENNPARKHNAEQSIQLDEKLGEIWHDHPEYRFISADKDFEDKKQHLANQISSFLKDSQASEHKKFSDLMN